MQYGSGKEYALEYMHIASKEAKCTRTYTNHSRATCIRILNESGYESSNIIGLLSQVTCIKTQILGKSETSILNSIKHAWIRVTVIVSLLLFNQENCI